MAVMNLGNILNAGFDQVYNLLQIFFFILSCRRQLMQY